MNRRMQLLVLLVFLIQRLSATQFNVVNRCGESINVLLSSSQQLVSAPAPAPRPARNPSPASRPARNPGPAPAPAFLLKGAPRKSKKYITYIIPGVCVSIVLLSCIIVFVYIRYKKAKRREFAARGSNSLQAGPQQFTYKELDTATNHFDKNLQLGEGGFGSVFKGTLGDGTIIAVKKMVGAEHRGYGQFKAEVMSIGTIHHVNLVRLVGFCVHEQECLLVYEYMCNGSLDKWILSKTNYLSWDKRLSIALGIAQGLDYLHRGCNEKVLHLDIKPQNILLDEKFGAKISDFGLSKLMGKDKSHIYTMHMRGTPGYMAPEWLHSRVTDKTDVYSFGIVLLQIVSSKSTLEIPTSTGSDIKLLSEAACRLFHAGRARELIDDRLVVDESVEIVAGIERIVCIGLWCIQEEPSLRPSMDTVVKMLEGVVQVLDPPCDASMKDFQHFRPPSKALLNQQV